VRTKDAALEFLLSCESRSLSPITLSSYRQQLTRFATSCPELPDGPAPIEAFLASITGSAMTRIAYFRVIHAFYVFISKRHKTPNPMADVRPPRHPKKVMATLQAHELMLLLASASTPRDKLVLTLLIDTGLRTSEVVNLRKQDIKRQTVLVTGKCGQREVPISEETLRLLAVVASQSPDEFVFHGKQGHMSRFGIYLIVAQHMKKAGIAGPKLGGHRIRHAFGKNYLIAGGDLRSLQELMGHADIQTTQKYAALNLNDITAKHHQFTPLKLAHAAAQGELFKEEALEEAEAIFQDKRGGE
jgi:site-specific recombinase XerD